MNKFFTWTYIFLCDSEHILVRFKGPPHTNHFPVDGHRGRHSPLPSTEQWRGMVSAPRNRVTFFMAGTTVGATTYVMMVASTVALQKKADKMNPLTNLFFPGCH